MQEGPPICWVTGRLAVLCTARSRPKFHNTKPAGGEAQSHEECEARADTGDKRGAAAEAAMAALQSWRKAYGALKDTTTVSLANLNSDFKVRRRILTHPPVLSPHFAGAKAVQFVSRRSCARRRIYGRAAAPHWVYWFSLACVFCFLRIWMSRS